MSSSVFTPLPSLRVDRSGRFFQLESGEPFFWLADTAWELIHRLNRAEVALYLDRRAAQGFNVIQMVVLAELDGLRVPNAQRDLPFVAEDPTKPVEAYFQHLDYIVEEAARRGLRSCLLPTWGDKWCAGKGDGPVVFDCANARAFGQFLGQRYANAPIIWMLGGDRDPENDEHREILRQMAEGLRSGDRGRGLMTYHPAGRSESVDFFHQDPWLDFNTFQSGHHSIDFPNYFMTRHARRQQPRKPVLDAEPNYEDHPIAWKVRNGWYDDFDSRRAGYWSVLEGACGHTYGAHSVWQMWEPGREAVWKARTPWKVSLELPGAWQAGQMRHFFESLPWSELEPAPGLLVGEAPDAGGRDFQVASNHARTCTVVYTPWGESFTLHADAFTGAAEMDAFWFNPRDARRIALGIRTAAESAFVPPGEPRRGNDWVLVLQAGA
jgi:hypothetical protein